MKVVGIDPAPRRGLTVFDGSFSHYAIGEAGAFLAALSKEPNVLICWDAPLTGPTRSSVQGEGAGRPTDFTQRPIESFFRRTGTGFKAPPGISVRGYSGCPHWTITRSLIGLPRVGPFDLPWDQLPFRLVTGDARKPRSGQWVVEVHPAVAAWLWCRTKRKAAPWDYKKSLTVLEDLQSQICTVAQADMPRAKNDDELDAAVAYLLGVLWLSGSDVMLLGNLEAGTFLLPRSDELEQRFSRFLSDD